MEIGPITGIRAVPMVKPSHTSPDLSHVYEVEYLGQPPDDAYTPANRRAGRGLEDEEDEVVQEDLPEESVPDESIPSITVNFFA